MCKEQWIKVTEALPELSKSTPYSMTTFSDKVLIFNGYNKHIGFIKQYFNDKQSYWFNEDGYNTEVTHWMYLPENPS